MVGGGRMMKKVYCTMFIYEIFFAKIIFWLKLDSNLGQLELPQEDALDHWASELVINFGRTLEI